MDGWSDERQERERERERRWRDEGTQEHVG